MKQMGLPTTTHLQSYTIGWLQQAWDLCMRQLCHLLHNIKPFPNEVLCDVSLLEVCDLLLGQPYLWKQHTIHQSIPCYVIISSGTTLYRILEVPPPTTISLIFAKKCSKVISQTGKFFFLLIPSQIKGKVISTSMSSGRVPPRSRSKWIWSWKNTCTSSPHPHGYPSIVRSSIQLV